jgi:hypothetical protein
LKEFGYNLNITFDEAKENKEVIALSDSQLLRSIRDIQNHIVSFDEVDGWYEERDKLKAESSRKNGEDNTEKIMSLQKQINGALYIQDYITVVMESPKQYEHIFYNGVSINGHVYRRFSCSAGQARVSTVVLVNEEIIPELSRRLNNGRDVTKKLAPSKFNAYFGLASSATYLVSEPRFVVVKDFINHTSFMANYVTETEWDKDDIVDQREVTLEMNRTDGMSLISPQQSGKWAEELGLDYIPAEWGLRQNFLKGMSDTFDFVLFCEEVRGGNYIVDTIYTDTDGSPIKADLRDVDIIITESMFKLWDSFSSLDSYIQNCHNNKLYWGVTQYSPKEPKNTLKLNYQFIQTLDLNQKDVENLCSQFVDWINGVSYDNPWYMMLFLLGVNNTKTKIKEFLRSNDNYWLKCLIVNPELKNDKYIRTKIRELIKKRLHDGCMGEIFVDGNFQTLVSDPYAMMQHVCGLEVTGLLKDGEFYSNYWNEHGVKRVDSMRSPLTYRSEHVILNLRDDEEVRKWYKYSSLGIIINYHGHEVCNWAGADFDTDILATTSNKTIIKGVYPNEYPVVYDPPKPEKIHFTEEDLFRSDAFSFGSVIGSITNKGSNAYALLPVLEKKYGKNSPECKLTVSRLQQCCKAQSCQIDKAKIGKAVKQIPECWTEKQKELIDAETGEILSSEAEKQQIAFYNKLLLNNAPYFFKYRYRRTKKLYDKYVDENEVTCHLKFGMSLTRLKGLNRHSPEQKTFLENYHDYMPVTLSDSSMNLLCQHIEGINFEISQKIRDSDDFDWSIYKNSTELEPEIYERVKEITLPTIKQSRYSLYCDEFEDEDERQNDDKEYPVDCLDLESKLLKVKSNKRVLTDYMVELFYGDMTGLVKDMLWDECGKYIYQNVKAKSTGVAYFPFPDKNGDIAYMGGRYSLREVDIL